MEKMSDNIRTKKLSSDEDLIQDYFNDISGEKVFVYLKNVTLDGYITAMSPNFAALGRSKGKKGTILLTLSNIIDIAPFNSK